jgi:hypothetical protein
MRHGNPGNFETNTYSEFVISIPWIPAFAGMAPRELENYYFNLKIISFLGSRFRMKNL